MGSKSNDIAELNLYEDLMAFTVLPPEQREAEAAVSVPQEPEPPRPAFSTGGGTRAATISVYKSPVQPRADENANQSFVLLDAEELLSDDPHEDHIEANEALIASGPLDVEFSQVSSEIRVSAKCRKCGSTSGGDDMFCLICGSMID